MAAAARLDVTPPVRDEPARIAFLIDSMAGPVAGTERQLWELLTRIDRRRFEPELLLLRPHHTGTWAGDWPCPVTQFRVERLLSARGVGELMKLGRYLSQRRIRLVHAFFPDSLLIGPILGYIAGPKWSRRGVIWGCGTTDPGLA